MKVDKELNVDRLSVACGGKEMTIVECLAVHYQARVELCHRASDYYPFVVRFIREEVVVASSFFRTEIDAYRAFVGAARLYR